MRCDLTTPAENLVTRAQLVFPADIVQTGIADANFDLSDPFTASINILSLVATAIYPQGNLNLGQINVPNVNPVISAPGHTQIRSYFLPLNFNLDPRVIIALLEAQASKNGVDLGPLPPLFAYVLGLSTDQLTSLKNQIKTQVLADQTSAGNAPECVSGRQFDVFGAILAALENLFVTLQIQSTVKLDDYQTDLDFNQYNVPAITDRTALYLIGAVAPPIVQLLVDQAVLTIQNANVTNVTDTGFTAALLGSLTNTGPFDAYILFPEGVDVYFMGAKIANIVLPPICSPAYVNVPVLQTTGVLTISDLNAFTKCGFQTLCPRSVSLIADDCLQLRDLHPPQPIVRLAAADDSPAGRSPRRAVRRRHPAEDRLLPSIQWPCAAAAVFRF